MSTTEEQLRQASDTLLASLDRLAVLEEEKRGLPPDDPRLVAVTAEIEGLASEILETATVQRDVVNTAQGSARPEDLDAPPRPIEASHRPAHEILEEWRAAERDLVEAEPGSVEAADALARTRTLRAEYQRAYQDVRREDRAN